MNDTFKIKACESCAETPAERAEVRENYDYVGSLRDDLKRAADYIDLLYSRAKNSESFDEDEVVGLDGLLKRIETL